MLGALALAGSALDRQVFLALNGGPSGWLPEGVASSLTLLGNGLAAAMLVAPFLTLEAPPRVLTAILYGAPLAGLASALAKRAAALPRPAAVLEPARLHLEGAVLAGHNSFPSGHSITIFLVATACALGFEPLRRRPLALAALFLLAIAVAASRVMVGAHWPADVLGGAAIGVLCAVAGSLAARRWPLWRHRRARSGFAVVVLGCALALALTDTGYPLARPLQCLLALVGAACAVRALLPPAQAEA